MTTIELTQGQTTIIDDKHADLAGLGWYAKRSSHSQTFYAARNVCEVPGQRRTQFLHRLIAERMGVVGAPDHKDQDGLNNREENLRPDPDGHNAANVGRRAHNTSGFKGVSWNKESNKWIAQITHSGKRRHLGRFSDKVEAAKAYDLAALKAFGEFAALNFPVQERMAA